MSLLTFRYVKLIGISRAALRPWSARLEISVNVCNSTRAFSISNAVKMKESGRIYILGVGNIGRLFAHALAKEENPPPITLLLHRASLLEEWAKAGKSIQITTNGVIDRSSRYDVEVIPFTGQQKIKRPIKNLIVATKTIHTLSALSFLKDRLSSPLRARTNILFAQNGMGTIEQVTKDLFPDISSKPNYLACVMHHGLYSEGSFHSVHAGRANMTIGRVENGGAAQYLIDKITQARLLSATQVTPKELFRQQVEKLVINTIINPLTVIFNCKNGELFSHEPIVKVMRALLLEASQVIQSLPELRLHHDTAIRFSPQRLEANVVEAAEKTAENTSSMLQDFRAGRETEIDYINGYIVERAKGAGVECETHKAVVGMVKSRTQISVDDAEEYLLQRIVLGRLLG